MRNEKGAELGQTYLAIIFAVIVVAAVLLVALPASAQTTTIKIVPIGYANPTSGEQMYAKYCASCHGTTGQGNGPAAPAFKHPPTNLSALAKDHGGTFPRMRVYQSIVEGGRVPAHGSVQMPTWGELFERLDGSTSRVPQLRLKALADYLETLQTK